jgi:hypothetical protein
MVFRWPIEIDGVPFLNMVNFHGELLNNQMVKWMVDWCLWNKENHLKMDENWMSTRVPPWLRKAPEMFNR